MLKEGDYLIYRFAAPLDCEKITVITGIPRIPIYYVDEGEVFYSVDGENYVKAGDMTYGALTFAPPKGLKAVKVVIGKESYAVYVAFTDLLIE